MIYRNVGPEIIEEVECKHDNHRLRRVNMTVEP